MPLATSSTLTIDRCGAASAAGADATLAGAARSPVAASTVFVTRISKSVNVSVFLTRRAGNVRPFTSWYSAKLVSMFTSPRMFSPADLDTTRVGSFVVVSMPSVRLTPPAVVMSTSVSLPCVRAFATLAAGSSAARSIVRGW